MRTTNPLRDILELAMRREEPLLDTEWPAGEVALHHDDRKPEPIDARFRGPVAYQRR
ncbi:MAG: hypothetical protein HYT80_03900 [Euryarchaeota archaeon]|nr:hypothetical protein [Euryarchaeota archaeon]